MIGMSWDKILKVIQVPNVNLDIEDKPPEYEESGPCKNWFIKFANDMQNIDKIAPKNAFELSGTLSNTYEDNTEKLKRFISSTSESVFCKIKEMVESIEMDNNLFDTQHEEYQGDVVDNIKLIMYIEPWGLPREWHPRADVYCHCTLQVIDIEHDWGSLFTLEFFTGNPFEEWMEWAGMDGNHQYGKGLDTFLKYFGSNDGGKSFRMWAVWYHVEWKKED